MGKIRLLATLAVLLGLLSSCGVSKEAKLDYSDGGYQCEFSLVCGENSTDLILQADAKDEMGERGFILGFGASQKLSGVCVRRKDGECSVQFGELSLECAAEEYFMSLIALFECDGKIIVSEPVEINGRTFDMITLDGEDGKRREVYLEPESGLPTLIVSEIDSKRVELRISAFKADGREK